MGGVGGQFPRNLNWSLFSIRRTPLSDLHIVPVQRVSMLERADRTDRKALDNNELSQVLASSGFSENKGLSGVLSLAGS